MRAAINQIQQHARIVWSTSFQIEIHKIVPLGTKDIWKKPYKNMYLQVVTGALKIKRDDLFFFFHIIKY